MDSTAIIDALSGDPGRGLTLEAVASRDGMPTIYVAPSTSSRPAALCATIPALRFVVPCSTSSAVDYLPREPRFEIVYMLACPGASGFGDDAEAAARQGARAGDEPDVPTRVGRLAGGRTGPSGSSTICSGSVPTATRTCGGS